MPIYEYECEMCHFRFDLRRHFGEDGGLPCPQCQGKARRLFSPVPVIFKGSGFYITDSRKNDGSSSDEKKSEKSESNKKSEVK